MNQIYVILGHITFIEPTFTFAPRTFTRRSDGERIYDVSMNSEGGYKAIIHRIDKHVFVPEYKLDEFCENSLNYHESYLIPTIYKGQIIYDNI